jgi:predicted metal-dependent hydrolase
MDLNGAADEDLPAYTLRVSARARRLQLRVTAWGEVEVVLPRHVSPARVAPFVREQRAWLDRTLAKLRELQPAAPDAALPARVTLSALNEEWRIDYDRGAHATARADSRGRILRVSAPDDAAAREALRRWLRRRATERLLSWLEAVSAECRLPFARATIRAQKTRWGSCSARGHISLNWQMIFLSPPLVRYLYVHELCHTVHLNHSRRYWALVRRHVPDYPVHERELRRAARRIPYWVNRADR